MLTLKESMELVGQNLLATLAPSHAYLPFWRVHCGLDKKAECEMKSFP